MIGYTKNYKTLLLIHISTTSTEVLFKTYKPVVTMGCYFSNILEIIVDKILKITKYQII